MAISTQTQNLNLIPGKSAPVVVHLSQGNIGDTVQFYLYNGAEPYVPSNVSIAVHGVRSDGSPFGPYSVVTTVGSSLVSFDITTDMTATSGAAIGELIITDSEQKQIGSANFGMLVEEAPYSSSVTYEDDLSIYQRILAYVKSFPASVTDQISAEAAARAGADSDLSNQIAALRGAVGSPLVASTKSAMTNTSKIYVYTGSETGMTKGNWYYYNGSSWVSGGVYNSVAVDTDPTLSISGKAADAKVAGDQIKADASNVLILSNADAFLELKNWESGDIYNGTDTGSNYRMRTSGFIYNGASRKLLLYVPSELKIAIVNYSNTKSYVSRDSWSTSPSGQANFRVLLPRGYSRIVVADAVDPDHVVITQSMAEQIKIASNLNGVVEQISNSVSVVDKQNIFLFEMGDLYNGMETDSVARARSRSMLYNNHRITLVFDATKIRLYVAFFNADGSYIKNSGWVTTSGYQVEPGTYFRIVLNTLNDEPMDLGTVASTFRVYQDDELPDYWETYLKTKFEDVTNAGIVSRRVAQFAFFTDIHLSANRKHTPEIINELAKNTSLGLAIFGGDVPQAYGTESDLNKLALDFARYMRKLEVPFLCAHGNHDWTIASSSTNPTYYQKTDPFIDNYSIGMYKSGFGIVGVPGKRYHYYDDKIKMMRYIIVDDWEAPDPAYGIAPCISQEQATWLVETALNVPEGYFVIVISHASSDTNITSHTESNVAILHEILKAYNNKGTVSISYRNPKYGTYVIIDKDFSSYKGVLVGNICGHNHRDESSVLDGVLSISTVCDASYTDDPNIPNRASGTINEQAFDIFSVDPINRTVTSTRIGAGSDRSFSF